MFAQLSIYVCSLLKTKKIPQFQWIFFNLIKKFRVSNQTDLIWNLKFKISIDVRKWGFLYFGNIKG